jgi:hypothetical protein
VRRKGCPLLAREGGDGERAGRAAAYPPVQINDPMVAQLREAAASHQRIQAERMIRSGEARGTHSVTLQCGNLCMLEVPKTVAGATDLPRFPVVVAEVLVNGEGGVTGNYRVLCSSGLIETAVSRSALWQVGPHDPTLECFPALALHSSQRHCIPRNARRRAPSCHRASGRHPHPSRTTSPARVATRRPGWRPVHVVARPNCQRVAQQHAGPPRTATERAPRCAAPMPTARRPPRPVMLAPAANA